MSDRYGPRIPLVAGSGLVGAGMALLAFSSIPDSYFTGFLPGLICFGAGMSLVVAPVTHSAISVESELSGVASGLNNAISRIAGLFAIACLGSVMVFLFQHKFQQGLMNSTIPDSMKGELLAQVNKLGGIVFSGDPQYQPVFENILNQSFLHSYRWVMAVCSILAAFSVLVSLFWIPAKTPDRSSEGDG